MPQVPYELTQGLNVVNPGIREGVDVKTYPNLQAEQMVESGRQMVHSGTNLKIMMDQVMLDRAETNAKGHDNIIADEIRVRMSGPNGFTASSGKNTVDQSDAARADVTKYVKDYISTNVKNPFEASIVSRVAGARLQHAYQTIDSHTLTQGKVYKEAVFVASMNGKINDIATATIEHGNNPLTRAGPSDQVAALIASRDLDFKQHFADLGIDEKNPIYKDALMKINTKQAQDITNNWVNQGKIIEVRAYLKANAKQIDQTAMNQMTQLVDIAALSKESMVLAKTLPGSFVDKQSKLDGMLKSESISDNLYRATSQQINKDESDFKQRTSESHANIEAAVFQWLDDNPTSPIVASPASLQQAMLNVPGLWKKVNKYDRAGNRFSTDADIYNEIMATSPKDLATYSDSDFYNRFRSVLNNEDWTGALARRSYGQGGKQVGTNIVSLQDQITMALKRNKILPESGKADLNEQQYAYNLTVEIQSRVNAEERRINAKNGLSEDANHKIISDVLLERVTRPGNFPWSSDVKVSPQSLPQSEYEIIKIMQRNGTPVNDETLKKAKENAGIR